MYVVHHFLNPHPPSPLPVLSHYSYIHPLQTEDTMCAQRRIGQPNASAINEWYVGA